MEILKIILFLIIAQAILNFISSWKLYKLAGKKPWEALVPIYNILVLLKIIDRPWWWLIILFIPIVGPIMQIIITVDFVRHYGRKSWLDAILAIFLSYIFLAYLNYSPNTKFTGKEERKETLVSAVLFAVIFATIIHTFIIQPFTIPTSSMERTLLVGDFLFVSKMNYGIRIPMTPVAIPFLQNKIPLGDSTQPQKQTNSYVDAIRLPYMRLPGWTHVKRYDIVVFNYPADSLHTAIDRKDPYVKRCVGIPGDKIQVIDGNLYINNKPEEIKPDEQQQRSYFVYTSPDTGLGQNKVEELFGYAPYQEMQDPNSGNRFYYFQGLTKTGIAELKKLSNIDSIREIITPKGKQAIHYYNEAQTKVDTTNTIFPANKIWNEDQYGPIKIPKKGDVIALNKDNILMYTNIIRKYEHNTLKVDGDKIFINGKPTNTYTIQQNYYWMMGDNRDASLDSRFFGFVPEDHIIGTPIFTWFSKQGWFENDPYGHPAKGKIRWNRMFTIPNNGEAKKTSYLPYFIVLLAIYFAYDYFRTKNKKQKEDKK